MENKRLMKDILLREYHKQEKWFGFFFDSTF